MTGEEIFKFRLYVADDTVNSSHAIVNLRAICGAYLPGRYKIELVDVLKDPDRALRDRVFMTPTLVKLEPAPMARLVGTLNQTELVLRALGLGIVQP